MKEIVEEILAPAGIAINGSRPWDIQIRNDNFYRRILKDGSLGLGEAYMEGWWDCERLDDFFCKILPCHPEEKIRKDLKVLFHVFRASVLNIVAKSRAFQVGERHYDRGNELFRWMLDKRMVYSCAYWQDADNLDDAQEAKLDLICRKLRLQPGDNILDIGCGWGGLVKYAAEKYGIAAVGITVSKEQADLARKRCAGLPIEIRLQDYRDVKESFDHVVSVGMFEHVGHKNYRVYLEKVSQCLREDGLFLLHTIGNVRTMRTVDPWFDKYIFPNSLIPSMKQISFAAEGLLVVEDWHNFGYYYDATLKAWFSNFDANWAQLEGSYDERFYRIWKYYLLSSAGAFRARDLQVWQVVLSKKGVPGGYQAIR
jgi:cyclopropane-fatty-acyl-phospholipid synthase